MSDTLIKLLDPKSDAAQNAARPLATTQAARNLYNLFMPHYDGTQNANVIAGFTSLCDMVKEEKVCLIQYERGQETLYALSPIEKAYDVVDLIGHKLGVHDDDDIMGWMQPEIPAIISRYQKPVMKICQMVNTTLENIPSLDRALDYLPQNGEWNTHSVKMMSRLAEAWGEQVELAYEDSILTVAAGGVVTYTPR